MTGSGHGPVWTQARVPAWPVLLSTGSLWAVSRAEARGGLSQEKDTDTGCEQPQPSGMLTLPLPDGEAEGQGHWG